MKKFQISNSLRSRAGFTLVELLLYIAIFSMLLTMLFQIFTSILDVSLESQGTSSVQADALYITNRFAYDIGRAESILQPSALSQSSPLAKIMVDDQEYTYTESSGNLILTNIASGVLDQLNSVNTNISNLLFTKLSANSGQKDSLTLSFTLASKVKIRGVPETKNFKTTITIRK